MSLRVVFMGTPDFAVPTLVEIVGQGHEVVAVYSQPPRPAGRGLQPTPSPVHRQAEALGIPVLTPTSLKSADEQERFRAHDADVAVVVAYGLILPVPILEAPREGCVNLHASLLPRWRGAAPIHRAIMAGDRETGVAVMRMEAGLDTGPVAMTERVAIRPDETTGDLHDRLARLGADLMVRALAALSRGALGAVPQAAEGVTYAAKIDKAEARIDWTLPAATVHDRIRGLSPFPGAWCEATIGGKPERVKVLRATLAPEAAAADTTAGAPGTLLDDRLTVACGSGAVRLIELQRAGGKALRAEDFLRGAALAPGARLG
ncbi:methionyl-tRNA formyltransferase [Prosthecomicrobium hirschii]|uniref:methionyl-tRNA formyltransferase n=1 Tax=Prosthecodimorpha hirschii TaxID=665126 RepID=UPI00112B55C2|nr:methionyl-tRNA formyltransferase [Prosthecomicrobium hirschii]TPQ50959.1 methionyl-tRNA formyltransferase [Prosthecomicrobium hirschii]